MSEDCEGIKKGESESVHKVVYGKGRKKRVCLQIWRRFYKWVWVCKWLDNFRKVSKVKKKELFVFNQWMIHGEEKVKQKLVEQPYHC